MSVLQINLQDDLRSRLAERAAESGFANVEEYVESLLRADVGEGQVGSEDDLEQLLLRRLDGGPSIDLTPAFIEQFKQRIDSRRQSGGKRP